ncbi:MAG: amidohydrolase [Treponema sp.]|jgi:amidohydrolase|nr:amidohydrolase [Treponema sp.]
MVTKTDIQIKEAVKKHFDKARELCVDLAAHPEISGEERESSAKFVDVLKAGGYRLEYPYCGMETAFRAVLENGEGPAVAILAEYDALPGIGHGCGHNLHGALSVLAGLALAELKDLFRGTVYVIGTPDEEITGGKIAMADRGVFDGLALAVMMHSCAGGFCQANMDALSLRSYTAAFSGQTAHVAASPWKGRSALAAARKFLDLVDARRECFTPDIKVNAIFTDGGEAVNVIPAHAELRVEFRTDAMGKLAALDETIRKCARGAAIALDCEESLRLNYKDFADMVRIPSLEDEVEKIFTSLGLKTEPVSPPIGSTDVGNVSYRCPAIQPLISISDELMALHTKEFAEATCRKEAWESMSLGAEAMAILVLEIFNDGDFRRKIGDEFQKRLDLKMGRL